MIAPSHQYRKGRLGGWNILTGVFLEYLGIPSDSYGSHAHEQAREVESLSLASPNPVLCMKFLRECCQDWYLLEE